MTFVVNKVFVILLSREVAERFGIWKDFARCRWVVIATAASTTVAAVTITATDVTLSMPSVAATPVAVAVATAAMAVDGAATTAVWPYWWCFGGGPAVRPGVVGQRWFVWLP